MTDYALLRGQLAALTQGVAQRVTNLANAASLLYNSLPELNWAGFYLWTDGALRLGPFMGRPACVVIPSGRGVCGSAFARGETLVVPDVHAFPGHIACDAASASELVVPLRVHGAPYGVLDLDSPVKNRFTEADRAGLENFARALERALEQTDAPAAEPAAGELPPETPLVARARAYVEELFRGDAGGHDCAHTLRVYRTAMRLAAAEPDCDAELTALAALLHDADDDKLFRTERNANARAFLEREGVDPARIDAVCAAVNAVSFRKNRGRRPETLEGKLVQDADRLDALGAVGVARTFAYGGAHGRGMEDSVAHFHDKLLLLAGEMNTEAAKRLAEPRHAFLEAFLREYEAETK